MKTTKYYECVICLSLNHASALHCHSCGTIPKMYSVTGAACNEKLIDVVVAYGASRRSQRIPQRIFMRTVPADYYAE